MISKRAARISPSQTLFITAKAKEMRANGIDVISFGAGEPDFDTPDYIKEAARKAMDEGFTKYTATSGIAELKKAVCRKLEADNGLAYAPANVLVSNGAKQCLHNILEVLVDPGDEVILPVPYWVSYEEMVKLAEGECVFVKTKNFQIEPRDLEKAVTKKTKVLILNSPSNPTGAVYGKENLEAIAEICIKNNIRVISDEIYEKLVYGKKHVSIASLGGKIKGLTVVVNGVSKSYSMTGWRIGYCAGDERIIKAAANLQDHTTSGPNSIAQRAALAALTESEKSEKAIAAMREEYKKRRDCIVDRLGKIGGVDVRMPDGAFYVFPDVSGLYGGEIKNSVELCGALLRKARIAVVPGSAFGDDNYVRFSYATGMENIKAGMDRFAEFASDIASKTGKT